MSWFLDLVPVVGTIKNTIEAIECIANRDMKGAFSKGTQAIIGGVLDVTTLGAASSVGQLAMKGAVMEVGKVIAKESGKVVTQRVMANVAARGVSKAIFNSASSFNRRIGGNDYSSTTLSHEELAKIKHDRQKPDRNCREEDPAVGQLAMKGVETEIVKETAKESVKVVTMTGVAYGAAGGVSKAICPAYRQAKDAIYFPTTISHEELAKMKHDRREPDRNGNEKDPASRGEHVINNNVLNVYRDIVNSFVQDVLDDNLEDMIGSGRLSPNSNVLEAINQPVPERIANFIRNIMVVHPTESYLDANSENYGREIRQLRTVIVSYMEAINDGFDDTTNFDYLPGVERIVRDTVFEFLAGRYYVDETALNLWLMKHKKESFDEAEKEVKRMFRNLIYDEGNDKVIVWVKELRKAKQAERK